MALSASPASDPRPNGRRLYDGEGLFTTPNRPPTPVPSIRFYPLEQVGDGVPIAPHCGDVIAERAAGDSVQMAALVIIGEGQVRDPDRLPEPRLVTPFGFVAGPGRDPRVDTDRRRVAAGVLGVAMQCGEGGLRFFAGRVGQWHPAVAPFGAAAQRHIGVTAIP